MAILMTAQEFIAKAKEIQKTKTAYMWGTYGRPITSALIDAKKKQYPKQYTDSRVAKLRALVGQGYHAWDCVGLIKGILWGWDGKTNVPYAKNGVPDTDTVGMMRRCTHRSTDFSTILPGCIMYKPGHVGIYIGDGLAVEASSAATSDVQITAVGNIGSISGYRTVVWLEHGRVPWIDYTESQPQPSPEPTGKTHTVVRGDTPWGLAKRYLGSGTKFLQLMTYNGIKAPYTIYVGQVLRIPDSSTPTPAPNPQTHTRYIIITPRGLNVRTKNTILSKRLRTLPTGRIVKVTQVKSGWGYVPAEKGWISVNPKYVTRM